MLKVRKNKFPFFKFSNFKLCPLYLDSTFTLGNSLFGIVWLAKNTNPDKYPENMFLLGKLLDLMHIDFCNS